MLKNHLPHHNDLISHSDGYLRFSSKNSADSRFDELGVPKQSRQYYQYKEEEGDNWIAYTYTDRYYALGIFDQLLYVNPKKRIIVVRLGERANKNYYEFVDRMFKGDSIQTCLLLLIIVVGMMEFLLHANAENLYCKF